MGALYSMSTTRAAIQAAGFVNSKPRYHQLIRDVNKAKRVAFCTQLVQDREQFHNIIFTDECTVQLHQNQTTVYRRKGTLTPHFSKPKHPLKLHVWAGISRKGATSILIFDGIMDSSFYVEQILQRMALPFIQETFGNDHRFMQDNDPKHT